MITQLVIEPADDLTRLQLIVGDRMTSITLTNEEVDGLIEMLTDYKKDRDRKFTKYYSVNLN